MSGEGRGVRKIKFLNTFLYCFPCEHVHNFLEIQSGLRLYKKANSGAQYGAALINEDPR